MNSNRPAATTETTRASGAQDAASQANSNPLGKRPIKAKRVESCKYVIRR